MKDLKNLKGAKNLTKTAQKGIRGGIGIDDPDCKCFCYVNNVQVLSSCRYLCADGTIPGVISGDSSCWTPNYY
jgi:hypothetical protein